MGGQYRSPATGMYRGPKRVSVTRNMQELPQLKERTPMIGWSICRDGVAQEERRKANKESSVSPSQTINGGSGWAVKMGA